MLAVGLTTWLCFSIITYLAISSRRQARMMDDCYHQLRELEWQLASLRERLTGAPPNASGTFAGGIATASANATWSIPRVTTPVVLSDDMTVEPLEDEDEVKPPSKREQAKAVDSARRIERQLRGFG